MQSSPRICARKIIGGWRDIKYGRPDQRIMKTLSALGVWGSESEYAETFIDFSKRPLCEECVSPIDNSHLLSQLTYAAAECVALTDAHPVNHDPLLARSLGAEICSLTLNEIRTAIGGQASVCLEALLGKLVNTILY